MIHTVARGYIKDIVSKQCCHSNDDFKAAANERNVSQNIASHNIMQRECRTDQNTDALHV